MNGIAEFKIRDSNLKLFQLIAMNRNNYINY